MSKISFILSFILLIATFVTVIDFTSTYASKVGGTPFCTVFPHFPECSGWRTEAITDSYSRWFCDYVDIQGFCENEPNPEKKIEIKNHDCCRYIGTELLEQETIDNQKFLSEQASVLGKNLPSDSIAPLIIWTDKDHYNFRDRVFVYGKFDFTNLTLPINTEKKDFEQTGERVKEDSIQTGRIIENLPVSRVDIELNGYKILRDIPVNKNGWVSAYFYLTNQYNFSTQNNLLEIKYKMTSGVIPTSDVRTHATYHFTTGDIAKKEKSFELWIDDSSLPDHIRYGIIVENPEKLSDLSREGGFVKQKLITTRLITPDGYTIPIKSIFSIKDLSTEYDGFKKYGQGAYQIQVTYGDNTAKKTFEYIDSN